MGYGIGSVLAVVGLVLALAVSDTVSGVNLQLVGWIMFAVGIASIVLTAITLNAKRTTRTTQTTVHSDGTQTVRENRTEM